MRMPRWVLVCMAAGTVAIAGAGVAFAATNSSANRPSASSSASSGPAAPAASSSASPAPAQGSQPCPRCGGIHDAAAECTDHPVEDEDLRHHLEQLNRAAKKRTG